MAPLRGLLQRAALVLLGGAAALVIGEIAARTIAPSRPVFDLRGLHELRPDEPWLYGLRPGVEGRLSDTGEVLYRINADGFRGPRHARPKPDGVFRLVVIGDSIAFGYAVAEDETFPRLLEARLRELAPQARVEVVNLGVGGYNAWNESELLKDVGLAYDPDLVLVQFCINDLNDPTLHFDAQTRVPLAAIPEAAFPDPSRRPVSAHTESRVWRWCARSRLCALSRDLGLAARETRLDDEIRRAAFLPVGAEDRPEWRWLEARYREMAEAAGPARFAVLVFPHQAQLRGRGSDAVQGRVLAVARRHGWTAIDPLPAFRRASGAGEPVFLDLWHPTPAGHRVAVEETLRVLACGGALGDAARGACPVGPDARAGVE
jgi:lysophospholipase L1-like esterase